MTKDDTLQTLQTLKQYNHNRTKLTKILLNGISIDPESCVDVSACILSNWLEAEEKRLVKLFDEKMIRMLYHDNEEWLEIRAKICALLTKEKKKRKKSLLTRMVKTQKRKIPNEDIDKAYSYFDDMQQASLRIEETLKTMKRRAQALSPDLF